MKSHNKSRLSSQKSLSPIYTALRMHNTQAQTKSKNLNENIITVMKGMKGMRYKIQTLLLTRKLE